MPDGRRITYGAAVCEAIDQEMARDDAVMVLGLGVDDHRAIYGTTAGLAGRFGPERVLDTPVAEEGMTGVAIGAAMGGLRPIQVHIRMDFLLLAMNQLVNVAAKARYMYGGQVAVPLVVRAIIGRSWGQGPQHSQGLHAMFMHVPGLRVLAPSTAYDAKGLLVSAIRDDDPVLFVEHRLLHGRPGVVPVEPYALPFGRARILETGADVTIIGISHMVVEAQRASRLLAEDGIHAEVVDPVTLQPLDVETMAASVARTGRLVVVDSGWLTCGAAAEIVTAVLERLPGRRVSFRRLGHAPVPCPTTRPLEDLYYPTPQSIAGAAWELVRGEPAGGRYAGARSPEVEAFQGPF